MEGYIKRTPQGRVATATLSQAGLKPPAARKASCSARACLLPVGGLPEAALAIEVIALPAPFAKTSFTARDAQKGIGIHQKLKIVSYFCECKV